MSLRLLAITFLLIMSGCASQSTNNTMSLATNNDTAHLSTEVLSTATTYPKIIDINDYSAVRSILSSVNLSVNAQIDYADDINLYGVDDYWASPAEVIKNGQGDCEDYAFLKRDILLKMGLPKERFKLIHVDIKESGTFAKKQVEQHIVLAYYPYDGSTNPIILDNMRSQVMHLRSRYDFHLNYVFDEHNVWKSTGRKTTKKVYNTDILPKFNDLLVRTVAE